MNESSKVEGNRNRNNRNQHKGGGDEFTWSTRIQTTITEPEISDDELDVQEEPIPADPSVKNFSFTNVDGQIYYRENSFMNKVELPAVTAERVLGMIALRETTRKLLDCQLHDGSDAEVQLLQNELKQQYTAFKAQYGLINSTANKRAFRQDSSYCLLASLEILDEEKNLKRLADIFTKRTIRKPEPVTSVDTPSEALRCLFRNPTYTGSAANGSRQIIAENCHEPYITKEQFYAFPCNMREGENKISIRKSYKKPNPLAKHIVCTCGYALCWHKDKKTEEELFYCRHCRAHKENGKNLKVPAATIYKKVMDALELEHLEEEKLAAAIQQGAGRKVIEAVRAEKSVQMKSVLAELNMEQFRRVPLYESYMADEITKEQYFAELLDYEEAHRKLNEQLTEIMEDTLIWERALSLRNPWIQQMAQYKAPEELDRNFVKKYIEQVTVTLLGDGQAEISLTMKTDEWKRMLGQIEMGDTDDGKKE